MQSLSITDLAFFCNIAVYNYRLINSRGFFSLYSQNGNDITARKYYDEIWFYQIERKSQCVFTFSFRSSQAKEKDRNKVCRMF